MAKSALEGTRLNAFGMDPNDLTIIGLDTKDGPEHPLYDPRVLAPLEESMVLSIMTHGVLEPVKVRKDGKNVEVVFGRRRVMHAREANKRLKKQGDEPIHVACMLERSKDVMGVAITENEIRKDDLLSAKAEKLVRYLATGKSEEDAAVAFGVTMQSIRNWLKISELDTSVVKAIDKGQIKASAAWNLAGLAREEQKQELEKLLSEAGGGRITAKKTKAAAKKKDDGEESYAPGKRIINKVLKLNKASGGTLPSDFVRGVLWVFGETNPSLVKGLTGFIKEASGETEE
jgi:ParB family chromosome partitioning protein